MFEVASRLEKHGIGHRIQRATWPEDSFWTITAIRPSLVTITPLLKVHVSGMLLVLTTFSAPLRCALTSLRCYVASQDGKHGDASGIFTWKGRWLNKHTDSIVSHVNLCCTSE